MRRKPHRRSTAAPPAVGFQRPEPPFAEDDAPLDEDEFIAEMWRVHPEYRRLVDRVHDAEHVFFNEEGEEFNPHLHVQMHAVLERQLRLKKLQFVRDTLARLEARGLDPHEARHAILEVVVGHLWDMLKSRNHFDEKRYQEDLAKL